MYTRGEKKNKGNVFENIKHFFPNARKERHIQTNGANSTYNSQTKETKYGTYESIWISGNDHPQSGG